ncbi:response regulator containing a CheY-like receiver domain and an HTH DNA-binding domain [Variovorax sp. CF313]|uniref:helix-turn-helix transcriptional regulator n=1 Tax=Variovorax sp. CF313 TaxID=1144315 RepID=UPI000270EC04|nr:LuxR family transcriptional regulator [Variovorax sp. CF313]EJL73501.1 response regulator containing a CheY-like receiver domain and an HTH DNA-binding domain [Variovorax sp. CF313]
MRNSDTDATAPSSDTAELPAGGPFPQLYSEEQLYLPPSADRHARGVPGIVGDLLGAGSQEERHHLIQGVLNALGFDWLGYGTITYLRGRWWPLSFFTAYANPEWVQRYFSHRLYEMDLRQQGVPASSLPLVWDVEQIESAPLSAAASTAEDPAGQRQRFVDDLLASGIRSGLMFRLASPTQVNQYTVISLQSSEPGRRWITDEVVGQALTVGLSLHEYLSRHSRMPGESGAARIEISTTQQYILQHLLQGRSDKEIANRLDLSAHTVDYHMRQLRRRFAARNRVQLVNAVQQGDSDFGVLSET